MRKALSGITDGQEDGAKIARVGRDLLATVAILACFLALIVGLSLVLGLVSVNMPPRVLAVDARLYRAVAGNTDARLTSLVFTFFNDPGVDYSVPVAACLAYVWWRRRGDMVAAAAAVGLTLIVGAWTLPYTQWFGFRPRPFILAPDVPVDELWRQVWTNIPSFPSGHIRELAGLSLVLAYFWPRVRWLALLFLAFIAFTRVYVGAHFPSDVLAGIIVGLSAGAFSLVAVDRGRNILLTLSETRRVRSIRAYVFRSQASDQQAADPFLAKVARAGLPLALLLVLAFAIGAIIYTTTPRILADYLRNTDNSLVYPLVGRFDPAPAQLVYWLFADASKTFPALAILILGHGAFLRGGKGALRAALVIILTFLIAQVTILLVSSHFERPRPFASGEVALPQIWRGLWPGVASLPDRYLLVLAALSSVLARQWRRLLIPAYLYPLLASASLLYFGAAWPTDAVATLLIGYFVAQYTVFLSGQLLPPAWRIGNDHPQRPGDNTAGNRSAG